MPIIIDELNEMDNSTIPKKPQVKDDKELIYVSGLNNQTIILQKKQVKTEQKNPQDGQRILKSFQRI